MPYQLAARQVDRGFVEQVKNQTIAELLGLSHAGIHRLLRVDSFVAAWRPLDFQGLFGRVVGGNRLLDLFGMVPWYEAVDNCRGVASRSSIVEHRLLFDFPSVANPNGNLAAV